MLRILFKNIIFTRKLFNVPQAFNFCQCSSSIPLPSFQRKKNEFFIDLIDREHFKRIPELSEERMIILNCFASWSSDCKEMNAKLQSSFVKYKDVASILNVDIDKHSAIVSQLQITSIPYVALIHKDSFIDILLKNGDFNKLIGSIDQLAKLLRGELLGDNLMVELAVLSHKQDGKQLIIKSKEGMENPKLKKYYPKLLLFQIRGELFEKELGEAEKLLDTFTQQYQLQLGDADTNLLYQRVSEDYAVMKEFQEMTPELICLLEQLDKAPEDLELRYKISEYAIANKNFYFAIKELLDVHSQYKLSQYEQIEIGTKELHKRNSMKFSDNQVRRMLSQSKEEENQFRYCIELYISQSHSASSFHLYLLFLDLV